TRVDVQPEGQLFSSSHIRKPPNFQFDRASYIPLRACCAHARRRYPPTPCSDYPRRSVHPQQTRQIEGSQEIHRLLDTACPRRSRGKSCSSLTLFQQRGNLSTLCWWEKPTVLSPFAV